MPIYEYECNECKSKFELLRSFSQADMKADCPRCRKNARKLVTKAVSFSRNKSGVSAPVGGGCSGCASHNCSTCGH